MALTKVLVKHFAEGKIVRMDNFGAFQVSVNCEGEESKAKFNASHIKSSMVVFRLETDMKEMLNNFLAFNHRGVEFFLSGFHLSDYSKSRYKYRYLYCIRYFCPTPVVFTSASNFFTTANDFVATIKNKKVY